MSVPIHDHAVVRGHACFDTCTVANGRLYRLDIHLDRHLTSATSARIPLPFGPDAGENKERMRAIVAQTVAASGCRNASVRYYTSVGPGGFGVTPEGCTSAFYCVVYGAGDASIFGDGASMEGVSEYTVRDVPLKPNFLANLKSNNYMLNVLTAMSAQDRGGILGILVDADDNIAESCVNNCIYVTQDDRLVTPPFDNILAGTTVRKVLQLGEKLVAEGLLKSVSQETVPFSVAKSCKEFIMTGGDHHVTGVTRWDDEVVGTGVVGKVTRRLMDLIKDDAINGNDDHYDVEYRGRADPHAKK
jgi:4-amino-4-deoxychorismate lyase